MIIPPIVGVAKLEFRDIMGYCMIYSLFYMAIISIAFLMLPYFYAY
jgi:short subunit fatty acids transporter